MKKIKNIFWGFGGIVIFLGNWDYNSFFYLKKRNEEYQKLIQKYNPQTNKEGISQNEIKTIIPFVKEIDLSSSENNKFFKGGYQCFIEEILKGLEKGDLCGYKNEKIKEPFSWTEIKKRMLTPQNTDALFFYNSKEKYLQNIDIKKIEIYGFYIETYFHPKPFFDIVSICFIIPAENYDSISQQNLFYLKYKDFTTFLNQKNIILNTEDKTLPLCSYGFENNFFTGKYISAKNIDINDFFKIKENNFKENKKYFNSFIKK